MTRIGSLHSRLTDTWRYALLGGLLSIPPTALGYWQSGSELSLFPAFLGAVLAGYLATRNAGRRGTVGARTGLVGTLPALWMVADVVGAASALGGPLWFQALALVTVVGTVLVVVFAFGALVGELGAVVGAWLARRSGRSGSAPASG